MGKSRNINEHQDLPYIPAAYHFQARQLPILDQRIGRASTTQALTPPTGNIYHLAASNETTFDISSYACSSPSTSALFSYTPGSDANTRWERAMIRGAECVFPSFLHSWARCYRNGLSYRSLALVGKSTARLTPILNLYLLIRPEFRGKDKQSNLSIPHLL
ncbi:hypothetical protein BKA82DRAFT_303243 [Pisolithus tinctorius]|uniref:Uncharacterized protein n=1 Tax=Pisolithus tinctorius Marx 270 TaxID=870435 RepID=A0A0C3PL41_PISTI|nr:hypothetical protein BKA82DRAFT_303243 [Pisolithus tinctorius]KIO08989.1 hypothetical protein M404DRAFT_303243 [Pisolithus tinctorius Marx 270]